MTLPCPPKIHTPGDILLFGYCESGADIVEAEGNGAPGHGVVDLKNLCEDWVHNLINVQEEEADTKPRPVAGATPPPPCAVIRTVSPPPTNPSYASVSEFLASIGAQILNPPLSGTAQDPLYPFPQHPFSRPSVRVAPGALDSHSLLEYVNAASSCKTQGNKHYQRKGRGWRAGRSAQGGWTCGQRSVPGAGRWFEQLARIRLRFF